MPRFERAWVGSRVTSSPPKATDPPVAGISPTSVRSSVVLPIPLWPRMPTALPGATANVTPFSTWMRP